MSDDIQPKLNTAYEHVEAGRLEEAISLLNPILKAAPDNADAWWIYTHAVSDPQEARRALSNVLRIAPDYPGASELQQVLDRDFPAPPALETVRPIIRPLSSPPPPPSMPEPPPNLPQQPQPVPAANAAAEQDAPDDMFDQEPSPYARSDGEAAASPSRTSILTIAIFAVVVAAIVLAIIFLNPGEETPPPTATVVAVIAPTSSPTPVPVEAIITVEASPEATAPAAELTPEATTEAAPEAVETSIPTAESTPEFTPEAVSTEPAEPLSALAELLSSYNLPEDADERTETLALDAGEFTVVRICAAPGPEARALIRRAMSDLAGTAATLIGENAQGYGVRLINCADRMTIVGTAVRRADAARFASGEINESAFASTWLPFR